MGGGGCLAQLADHLQEEAALQGNARRSRRRLKHAWVEWGGPGCPCGCLPDCSPSKACRILISANCCRFLAFRGTLQVIGRPVEGQKSARTMMFPSSSRHAFRAVRRHPVLGGCVARLWRSLHSFGRAGASRDNHTAEGCPRAREAAGGARRGRRARAAGRWRPRRQRERLLQDRPQQVRPHALHRRCCHHPGCGLHAKAQEHFMQAVLRNASF